MTVHLMNIVVVSSLEKVIAFRIETTYQETTNNTNTVNFTNILTELNPLNLFLKSNNGSFS